ncbi:HAD family phosphatase [Tessaracoccus sp. OH4464_COT-324]|uniref:HAD family hydrolase n=1 Tax=Tessaracoccus sp. OH4464_COT-324 TaxID=2491059 RepID=UPI0018F4194F|nr:HAD family phosphatase [Tessaracoccus sp. OH4464_COT-324]
MSETLAGVVWDFDGTLVDTEPLWARVEIEMLADHGVHWGQAEMRQLVGQDAVSTVKLMADAVGSPELFDSLYEQLHRRVAAQLCAGELPYLPGALRLLGELTEAGVRSAIVTASSGLIIEAARARLPESIEFIITADDVARPKPDPEAYTLAFAKLGLRPHEVIVLEDSLPGIAAGLAAGSVVYGVPMIAEPEEHPRLHLSDDGLATTDLAKLTAVWQRLKEHND